MAADSEPDVAPQPFERVLLEELREIEQLRALRGTAAPREEGAAGPGDDADPVVMAHRAGLVGLAFSGGGIRSATFNLGVLQSLARLRALHFFDYLSTVSGGGYIGSWLTSWLAREKHAAGHQLESLQSKLDPSLKPGERQRKEDHEPTQIRHLRDYSNYLTPRRGLGIDTAHTLAMMGRNLLLTLMVPVLILGAAMLLPHLLSAAYYWGLGRTNWFLTLALVLFLFSTLMIASNIPRIFGSQKAARSWTSQPGFVIWFVVFPFITACWLTAGLLYVLRHDPFQEWSLQLQTATFLGYFGLWLVPALIGWLRSGGEGGTRRTIVSVAFLTSLFAGTCLLAINFWMRHWPDMPLGSVHPGMLYGGPLVAITFALTLALHVGLSGAGFSDADREWTSRFGGTLLLWTTSTFLLMFFSAEGYRVVAWAQSGVAALLAAGWLGTTGAGVTFAQRAAAPSGRLQRWVVAAAPTVFVVGLFVTLSSGIHALGLHDEWQKAAFAAGLATAIGLLLSTRIGVNRFSLHALYKNRLARCYLGASNVDREETRNPWTDLATDDDDVHMSDLTSAKGYRGPYPLVNTTLNLVATRRLAWQQRRAASFVLSPLYSGFDVDARGEVRGLPDDIAEHGYRPTRHFGGNPTLGTAMAISGAAVSPNMGHFSTSRSVAMLLALFNLRLGWWLGNPRHEKTWKSDGPWFGFRYLLYEMLGLTHQYKRHVYLSDGGHFENLGLYELIRRRCRYVIVCDAEEDRNLRFSGLGNAIEKCRTDLGVDISIDLESLRRSEETGLSRWHCAVGRIDYRADPERPSGILVYLKASLTGNESVDVQRYAAKNPDFPHQSTGDQWFDESQFESYRALGYHVVQSVFAEVKDLDNTEEIFVRLRQRWHPPTRGDSATLGRHATTLNQIEAMLGATPELRFLAEQIYPEWPKLREGTTDAPPLALGLPDTYGERDAGFHACVQMLQLMENVYLDLDLETQFDHPDHRGWMNLFHHWAWSSMFRVTWAIAASTFGASFQAFCRRHLQLDLVSGVHVKPLPTFADLEECSFLEKKILKEILETGDAVFGLELAVPNPRGGVPRTPEDLPRFSYSVAIVETADEVVGVEVAVPEPAATPAVEPDELIRFRFGVAVVRNEKLRYLRVQDHLRKMGLARQAMLKLLEQDAALDTDTSWIAEDWNLDFARPTRGELVQFERAFSSAKREFLLDRLDAEAST